jgi:ribosomal protein S18 acetylase RimI-like enzyme
MDALEGEAMQTRVACVDETLVGFVVARIIETDLVGEIYMLAVAPACRRRGVARGLSEHTLEWMKARGVRVAMVETGGEPGHEPARRTYEAIGFSLWPVARYYRRL